MFLRRDSPAAGEGLVEQFNFGHVLHRELAPVRQCAAAALARELIGEEMHNALLNAVILWLNDANLVVIEKPQQAFLMDGAQNELMNSRIYVRRRWVPHYMKRSLHSSMICEFQNIADKNSRVLQIYEFSSS